MTHSKIGGVGSVDLGGIFVLLTLNVNFFEMCVCVRARTSDTETNL